MPQITVRFFAAARAASGVESDLVDVASTTTLAELEDLLAARAPRLAAVLPRCSYLRDEIALCDRAAVVVPCETLDVLPPFAGG